MKITDKKLFAELMAGAGEVYDKAITTSLLKIYFDMLDGYEIGQVQQAIKDHMRDSNAGRFFPKPADIVAAIEARDPQPSVEHQAELAWAEVMASLEGNRRGLTGGPVQSAAVEALGGMRALGRTDYAELKWVKRDFLRIYAAMSESKSSRDQRGLDDMSEKSGPRLCASGPVRIGIVTGAGDEPTAA
jgi:hypothetical protein